MEYDLSNSADVTELMKFDFLSNVIETGEIPEYLNFYNRSYEFFKVLNNDFYYYKRENKDQFIHLHIEKTVIQEAEALHENLQNFYDKIK